MTEHEYVEHIRRVASAYLAKIESHQHGIALGTDEESAWARTKESMSPLTMAALCDAWLAQQSAEEPEK
jgi:hypothetical protein